MRNLVRLGFTSLLVAAIGAGCSADRAEKGERPETTTSAVTEPRHWISLGTCFSSIALGKGLWAIGCGNGGNANIYRRPVDSELAPAGAWQQVSGAAKKIAAAPGLDPWVITAAGAVFRWNGGGWELKPGCATDIAVGIDTAVGTANVYKLGCSSPADISQWNGTGWTQLGAGKAKAISADTAPWVLGLDSAVWRWDGQQWNHHGAQASVISSAQTFGGVFVVGLDNRIWGQAKGGGWEPRMHAPSSLPITSIIDFYYAVDSGGTLYHSALGFEPVPLYRGAGAGDHFLTIDRDEIVRSGYQVEGPVGKCWTESDFEGLRKDLHRLYRRISSDHLYTMSNDEELSATDAGFEPEPDPCKIYDRQVIADSTQTQPLHRFYNQGATEHLYTTNQAEIDNLCGGRGGGGWQYEGVAGYLLAPLSVVPSDCPRGTGGPAGGGPGGVGPRCQIGQSCCRDTSPSCAVNSECNGGICEACGLIGQKCCGTTIGSCAAGSQCNGGVCEACGNFGQKCCGTTIGSCGSNLACSGGRCE